jgi:hypothetical protein
MPTKKETTPTSEKKTTVKKAPTERKTSGATASRKTTAATAGALQAAPAAEAKSATKPTRKAAAEKPAGAPTRVMAYVDVGLGNTLFLRGEGPGLSWEAGVPMQWIGDGCWSWTAESAGQGITFKVLINDLHWSGGDNLTVAPGDTASFTPAF